MRHGTLKSALLSLAGVMFVALMVCCGHGGASRRLAEADAVIEERPDSALRILEAIDTASLRRERDLRLRDLLLAQARVKLDLGNADTVPLAAARKYFSLHPEKDYRLRSNFYMGYLGYQDSCFISGTGYAADAFLEARDRRDSYWTAKSAELISLIIGKCEFPAECIMYDSIAAEEYGKAGRQLSSMYSRIDHALDLGATGKYKESDWEFNKIVPAIINEFGTDTLLVRYALVNAIDIKIKAGGYSDLKKLLDLQQKYVSIDDMDARELLYIAKYLLYVGNMDKARAFIGMSENRLTTGYDRETYELVKGIYRQLTGDGSARDSMNLAILPLVVQSNKLRKANPVASIISKKRDAHSAEQKERQNSRSVLWIVAACIAVMSGIGVIIIRNRNHKKLRLKYQVLINELQDIEQSVEGYRKTIDDYRDASESYKESAEAYYHKYSVEAARHHEEKERHKKLWHYFYHSTKDAIPIQNIVLETLHDLNGVSQNDNMRIKDMRKRLARLFDKEFSDQLYSTLCIYKKDQIDQLNRQIPGITGNLLKYFVFSISGFSTVSISVILQEKEKSIYSNKNRLIEKIRQSNAEDKENFINLINRMSKGKDL